ncbi:hypothetical protein FACS1894133_4490 [Clostridia bacterium]|nr:hypothetical protein FACS1894133_4490 [Clostridia bacterium]
MSTTEMKTTSQRVERIALSEIKAGDYQRPTSDRQVANIAENFDTAKLGMPVVSERDGHYYLLDGNHRVAAMRILEFTHAQFIVLEGLDYEAEADFFRRQNENVRQLTKYNLYKAALEANDPLTVNINDVVKNNGFSVGMSTRNFNTISAIYALETVATIHGCKTLSDTLNLLRLTWNGQNQATFREFIVGVAEFVDKFGTVDFAERMKFKEIGVIWQDYLQITPRGSRKTSDPAMRRSFCRVLVDHYNKGLSSNSKKRLSMEGR